MDEELDVLEGLSFDLPDGTVIITAAEGAFGGLEQLEDVQARLNQAEETVGTDSVIIDQELPVAKHLGHVEIAEDEEDDITQIQRQYFAGLLEEVEVLWKTQDETWNEVSVVCRDAETVRLPGLVLAAVCPVFRVTALSLGQHVDGISLPDISKSKLVSFVTNLWNLEPGVGGLLQETADVTRL